MPEIIIIEPGRQQQNYWRDLWRNRELFWVLAWRDLAVRYKQTAIGLAWALVRPFLAMREPLSRSFILVRVRGQAPWIVKNWVTAQESLELHSLRRIGVWCQDPCERATRAENSGSTEPVTQLSEPRPIEQHV